MASATARFVAPASVVHNWAAEAGRFTPDFEVRAIIQTAARRGDGLPETIGEADVVVTSYTLFRLEYDDYAAMNWAGLVLDEAQFVKNPQSQAYKCARRLPAPFKIAITGTPMENNLAELWALCSIAAPGLFPRLDRFTEYYRNPIERERDRDRLSQLRRRIRPLVLRRRKSEVAAELPAKQEQVVEVDLSPGHRSSGLSVGLPTTVITVELSTGQTCPCRDTDTDTDLDARHTWGFIRWYSCRNRGGG